MTAFTINKSSLSSASLRPILSDCLRVLLLRRHPRISNSPASSKLLAAIVGAIFEIYLPSLEDRLLSQPPPTHRGDLEVAAASASAHSNHRRLLVQISALPLLQYLEIRSSAVAIPPSDHRRLASARSSSSPDSSGLATAALRYEYPLGFTSASQIKHVTT